MPFKLINKSRIKADINLHNGKRLILLPNSSITVEEELTPRIAKYYEGLRSWEIYVAEELIEVNEEITEEIETDEISEEIDSTEGEEIEDTDEVPEDTDDEALSEEIETDEVLEEPEFTESQLMAKRHGELLDIVKEKGLDIEGNKSKKELTKLILGEI